MHRPLPRSFYMRSALTVAPELLGCLIVRRIDGRVRVGRIVEVEAYRQNDPASHSYRGRTPRNDVMFGPGGFLYVYFTYGMHFCANVTTGPEGRGEAVLLRAIEPIEGIEQMRRSRPADGVNLSNGPAKLCQALHIGRNENGIDLRGEDIFILRSRTVRRTEIGRSGRIGIRVATEKRWRFFMKGNAWVGRM